MTNKLIANKPAHDPHVMRRFWHRFDRLYEKPAIKAAESGLNHRIAQITLGDGDVVVNGVYKSGTTWLMQILHQIRTGGDENFDDIYNVTKHIGPYFINLPSFDPEVP